MNFLHSTQKQLANLSRMTLEELATEFGMELQTTNDLLKLVKKVDNFICFNSLTCSCYSNLPIIKHFHTQDGHYFAFEELEKLNSSTGEEKKVFLTVWVGDNDFGFQKIIDDGYNVVCSDLYQTVEDIFPLLERFFPYPVYSEEWDQW